MDPLFRVEVLSQTPDPERVIWQAMHQDYSPDFVSPEGWIPANYGEAVVRHLLEGDRGHYGPLEHPQITFAVGYFPHVVMQQARTQPAKGSSLSPQRL
jgi:thymidylate synthase (FAD)